MPAETFIDAPDCGPLPSLWRWTQALATGVLHDRFLMRNALDVSNIPEIMAAEYAYRTRTSTFDLDLTPIPPEIPLRRLTLPDKGFSPDYFAHASEKFASRRLRHALALPPEIVEFVPIELLAGGEAARAQDYRLMRVLAEQPAMDLDRSDCRIHEGVNWVTGEPRRTANYPCDMVLHHDFHPRTALFRVQEDPTTIIATDALALQVLQAGCTGVAFADFTVNRRGMHIARRRTLNGLALLRVGFLD